MRYLLFAKTQKLQCEPITAINDTMKILVKLTESFPIGTNLALLQFMWMLIIGALLPQRGVIFSSITMHRVVGTGNASMGSLSGWGRANSGISAVIVTA